MRSNKLLPSLRQRWRTSAACFLVLLGAMLFSMQLQAESVLNLIVHGKVVSADSGSPLAGVYVTDSQNPSIGTTTDADGAYRLELPDGSKSLKFSYLGYLTQLIRIDGKTAINVSLRKNSSKLDELVVVGYGTQKKINQTGSTQTVRFNGPVNTPVTNADQLMYSKFSGVQLTQGGGLPGSDGSSLIIRGVGTFGSTTPLVVIDNIQYNSLSAFENLAPSDIASISVLKDAAASAIYGARGANGVIVVTTKQGRKGKMQVSYNGYIGTQRATVIPHYLDAVNYAKLRDEFDLNSNGPNAPLRYADSDIQAIMDGSKPDVYGNTNWVNVILKAAPIQNHYLSFSGGSQKTSYRVSLGYQNQDAIVQGKFRNQRYNFSSSLSSQVKPWLNITNVTNSYWTHFTGPAGGPAAIYGETGILNQFQRSAPTVVPIYSNGYYGSIDGSYTKINASFPITNALQHGVLGDYKDNNINLADRFGIKATIAKYFSIETSGSINFNLDNTSNFNPTSTTYDFNGNIVGQNLINNLTQSTNSSYRLLNENLLRYHETFSKKHDISVLLGQSVMYDRLGGFSGSLSGFPSNAVEEFNGGGVVNPSVSGSAEEVSLQSFFGRVDYIYDGKYLLEGNIRRDGSSRFGADHRYGNFPSASAGWIISKENFLKHLSWLSELKLRGSWGITGNDNIGNYIYEQTYNSNLAYTLGAGTDVTAVALTSLANPSITWETIKQTDIGLDAAFFNGSLTFTGDYFSRNSYDILYTNFPIPSTIGVSSLAAQNAASMLNQGEEASLSYQNSIGLLRYNLSGSVTHLAVNRVTGLGYRGVPTITGTNIITIGEPFNAYYGYKVVGVFQSADQVSKAPSQFGDTKTAAGDFQYADISGPNGVPDGKIDAYDRTVIGDPNPKWLYNFDLGASLKGFDLNVALQGVQGVSRLLNANGELPLSGDRNNGLDYWINRWTPANPSTTLPRIGGQNNDIVSTFYIQDASYLRLKNLELGYTIPSSLTRKYGLSLVRIYFAGDNLLTFTKMKYFDPERAINAASDQNVPLYKVYTFGLNLKF